jgi:TRAP transporter TAXI family solute receptor
MKKFINFFGIIGFLVIIMIPVNGFSQAKQDIAIKELTMVTSPIGGVWYTAGAKISEIFQKDFNLRVTVDVGSSAQNVRRINAGKDADFGMASTPEVWNSYNGMAPFKGKHTNVNLVGSLGQWCFQVLAREGSGISSWKDFKNKRYAPAAVGSGSEILSRYIFEEIGLSYDIIRKAGGAIQFRSFSDSVEALKDGNLDAMAMSSLYPIPNYEQYLLTNKGYFLPVEEALQKKIVQKYPAYMPAVMPAGIYRSQDKPVPTLGYHAVFIARADLPESAVYKLTKSLYQHQNEISGLMAGLKNFGIKEALQWNRIPFHPGAKKYFKEVGIWKD